ncbi:MAG: amino acid ABC transporter substrate-binding protein [Synergistetes bacterium]|nr:amino acid ABC transporter substrate-binding protein [Synergistota bacterium]
MRAGWGKKALFLGIALVVTLTFWSSVASAKGVIKIGVLSPLSGGAFAEAGQEQRRGFLMALDEINSKGGVLGKKIELIYEDTKCDPSTGVAAARKLIEKDKVIALLGGYSSTVTYAICGAIKRYKPLMIWIGASSTKVEHLVGKYRWFFHLHPWDYHRQTTVVKFLESITPKPKTIAFTYEDGLYGTTSADYFLKYAKEAGFKIVMSEPHKSGSSDFTPLLTKAKSLKPDVFYSVSYAGDYILQIKQSKEINFSPKLFLIVAPNFPDYKKLGKTGDYVAGVDVWIPSLPIPGLKEWLARFHKRYPGRTPEYWVPLAYANLYILVDAIKRAGTTDKDALIKALEKTDLMTPMGRITFKPSKEGCIHQGITELIITQWQNGKSIVVWPPDKATGKLIYPVPPWDKR